MPKTKVPPNICPCCKRRIPAPRIEKLKPKLAEALRKIYEKAGLQFSKIPAYVFKAQHSRLKHWGLLEEQTWTRPDGSPQRRPGVWRVTEKGEEWLAGYSRVPYELHLEQDKVILASDTLVTFDEALNWDREERDLSDYERYMRESDNDEEGT